MASSKEVVSSGSMYFLQEERVKDLELEAMGGSVQAAQRLVKHYRYAALDKIKGDFWTKVAAELNDPASQYNLAKIYVAMRDFKSAKYWADEAHTQGFSAAEELLSEIGRLAGSDQ